LILEFEFIIIGRIQTEYITIFWFACIVNSKIFGIFKYIKNIFVNTYFFYIIQFEVIIRLPFLVLLDLDFVILSSTNIYDSFSLVSLLLEIKYTMAIMVNIIKKIDTVITIFIFVFDLFLIKRKTE